MNLYAIAAVQTHAEQTEDLICLRWKRQLPSAARDWMLAWAAEEGSAAAIERSRKFDGGSLWSNPGAWPARFRTSSAREDGMWKLRRDLKKEGRMCGLCEWFDEGPCCSNAIVVDSMNVHHSFGCSGALLMSDWFVRNLCWLGNEPSVEPDADEPEWVRWLGDDRDYEDRDYEDDRADGTPRDSWPMFCESQKHCAVYAWTAETVVESRECLARLGEPSDDTDKDALEETLEVLAWVERNLAAGLSVMSAHDF